MTSLFHFIFFWKKKKKRKRSSPKLLPSCLVVLAAVKDIDRFQEKITVSLHKASLPPSLEHIKLGVLAREELPVHYRYLTRPFKAQLILPQLAETVGLRVSFR